MSWPLLLHLHEKSYTSQNGEDGILRYIFRNIGTTDKYYVEFGASGGNSGQERNTRMLQSKYNWTGLLMDGASKDDPTINLHHELLYTSNIQTLFHHYGVPREFDLLSIDIDSTDLWIWLTLCGPHLLPPHEGMHHHKMPAFRPRVVVAEFNGNYDLYEYYTFPNNGKVFWIADYLFGASLSALYLAGRQMGYTLIYVDRSSVNAFFLRDDLLPAAARDVLSLAMLHPSPRQVHQPRDTWQRRERCASTITIGRRRASCPPSGCRRRPAPMPSTASRRARRHRAPRLRGPPPCMTSSTARRRRRCTSTSRSSTSA